MQTSLEKLKSLFDSGDTQATLKYAAGWNRLGEYRDRIQTGYSASRSPEMYWQMGKDPDSLVIDGIEAIKELGGWVSLK